MAEDATHELPNLPLEDALQLVHLYAERGSPKYEKAARLARAVPHRELAEAAALRGGLGGFLAFGVGGPAHLARTVRLRCSGVSDA